MFKKILISLSTIFILIFAGCATKRQFIAANTNAIVPGIDNSGRITVTFHIITKLIWRY